MRPQDTSALRLLLESSGGGLFHIPRDCMPFLSFFSPRVITGLLFAGLLVITHLTAYKVGRALVAGDWAEAREAQALEAVVASEKARAQEQALTQKVNDVAKQYELEKKRRSRDAAAAAGELRKLQDALASSGALDPTTPGGTDASPTGGLLLECAGSLTGMAAEADTTGGQLISLQSYVSEVCK